MSLKFKTVLLRFVRGVGGVAVAFSASYVVSEDVLGLVPDQYDWLFIGVLAPALIALEKYLRYGSDPGEV